MTAELSDDASIEEIEMPMSALVCHYEVMAGISAAQSAAHRDGWRVRTLVKRVGLFRRPAAPRAARANEMRDTLQ